MYLLLKAFHITVLSWPPLKFVLSSVLLVHYALSYITADLTGNAAFGDITFSICI
jgi:hypothetical protein